MINEIMEMSYDLDRYNINCSELWHSSLPKCSKISATKVLLTQNGKIKSIELFDKETYGSLRYYYPNNHRQFPSFKISKWMQEKDYEFVMKNPDNLETYIKNILQEIRNGNKLKSFNKFKSCMENCRKEIIEIIGEKSISLKSMIDLSRAIEKSNLEELYVEILRGVLNDKNKNLLIQSCTLAFDVHQDIFDNNYIPVQHPKTFEKINEILLQNTAGNTKKLQDEYKDYLGNSAEGCDCNSTVKVPTVGTIRLYDKNDQAPMNERYGFNGKNSFIIGEESMNKMMRAFQFLTHEDRQNITFKNLGKEDGKTVLSICYWDGLVENLSTLSPFYCVMERGEQECILADFETESKNILSVFHKISHDLPESKFKVFCIKVPSNGTSYVDYQKKIKISGIIEATTEWIKGCKYIPNVQKDYMAIPSPFDFYRLINKTVSLNLQTGMYEERDFSYFSIGEIYDFFLGDQKSLKKIVNILASNHSKMIVHNKNRKMNRWIIPSIIPMLGLALYRSQKTKEEKMNELGYQLGQFCAISNELQKIYFKHRGHRIPEKLLGSYHFSWMMIDPSKALTSLYQRVIIYHEWISCNIGKVPYAAYYLAKIKEIDDKIAENLEKIETLRLNDLDKISMSIGYSMGLTKLEKEQPSKETINVEKTK